MSNELLQAYLDSIAAKAKQLAEEARRGRLWDGDAESMLGEIIATATKARNEAARH